MPNPISLASAKITPTAQITVELVEDQILIHWPEKATPVSPRKLAEVASAACRVLANASTELSRTKARGRL